MLSGESKGLREAGGMKEKETRKRRESCSSIDSLKQQGTWGWATESEKGLQGIWVGHQGLCYTPIFTYSKENKGFYYVHTRRVCQCFEVFSRGPDHKHFSFWSRHRQYVSAWVWLYSGKTIFRKKGRGKNQAEGHSLRIPAASPASSWVQANPVALWWPNDECSLQNTNMRLSQPTPLLFKAEAGPPESDSRKWDQELYYFPLVWDLELN